MKEFAKVLACAIVGTFVMLGIVVYAADVLRSYSREIVSCVIISVVAASMVSPLFVMDSKKEWTTDIAIFCMGFFPIQGILIAAFL